MLSFTCPSCHKHLKGPEAMAGRKSRCPQCQEIISVPGDPSVTGHSTARPSLLVVPVHAGPAQQLVGHLDATPLSPGPPPPADSRSKYFAPAGYAETASGIVPFLAPELRRRLKLDLEHKNHTAESNKSHAV